MKVSRTRLELPQTHALDRVVRSLLEDQARPVFGGLDVLLEVGMIDLLPYAPSHLFGILHREARETVKVSRVVLKCLFSQAQEAV